MGMFSVVSCVWFTSGQEMIDVIDIPIDMFKASILDQAAIGIKQPKTFGWNWVINAMIAHDPCEFFWTVKGVFTSFDSAQAMKLELLNRVQFPFNHKPHFIDGVSTTVW